jgi:hypothetical protein
MNKKQLGNEMKEARSRAVTVLAGLKGENVQTLNINEIKELLAALLQLMGLADPEGNIK